jgi:FtsP/CotA-like multicopper oxidase with cupredoxin domain
MSRRRLTAVGVAVVLAANVVSLSAASTGSVAVTPPPASSASQPVAAGQATAGNLPLSPTDETKVPHYFGPYPNYANSAQALANAVVTISLGTPTPVLYGNPLVERAYATDYATPPGTTGPVLVVLESAPLPAGLLSNFQIWNQGLPGASPTPSAGGLLTALVLRPTATADQYDVVYASSQLTVPVPSNPTGEVTTFPVAPAFAVQAGDRIGFYGQGVPVDTGIGASPDLLSYPATADVTGATNVAPATGATLTLGADPTFPIFSRDRTYSFAATVQPTIVDPGTGAEAVASVDPRTGGISGITVTSPGAGYLNAPSVTITAPGLTPTPAAATATISTGVISSVTVHEAGFGFTAPQVTVTGGSPTTAAVLTATGGVDDVVIADGGQYAVHPIVEFSRPAIGSDIATGTATLDVTGAVTGVTIINPGSGYTSAPTVAIWDGEPLAAAPVPAQATATIGILAIDITSGGTGYDAAPVVAINDTVGTADKGASATATVAVRGSVTGITVTNPGAGYITPGIKKFVDTLPGLGAGAANDLGTYIPVGVPDTTTYPGSDYYEIGLVQYRHTFHESIPATLVRGYVQLSTSVVPGAQVALSNEALVPGDPSTAIMLPNGDRAYGVTPPHYLGPTIVATKDRPVRILFRNLLPTGVEGDLFLPVDTTLMGSGEGPDMIQLDANGVPLDMATDNGTVMDTVRNPVCAQVPKNPECYAQSRATLHLHGGITPWISDGTPHQWITPAGEDTRYPEGVSVSDVPDMPAPEPGSMTFFYTNQQSARLMFYHDHAYGITRLNVYAGEAAGYLITDETEQAMMATGGALEGLGLGTPLIIQDKTFVPDDATMARQDPTWDKAKWGGEGSLWAPHVYMPAQNPGDPSGMSSFGRWMYGPWFWPPAINVKYPPIDNPYYDPLCDPNVAEFCEPALIPGTPNVSVGMEAFNDTPVVNGTAYPTTTVDPKAYRFRILNAANDRFWNLSWYVADPTTGTLSEVALKPAEVEAAKTDTAAFPTPDETRSPKGPAWIQIGTEGGFLPAPAVLPAQPTTWITDPTRFDVGNVDQHSLLLAPAERADVIVDFAAYRGKTLILYNDAPAAFPARVACYDYYTDNADLTPACTPTTLPGYGPNTRTVMQVKVSMAVPALAWDRPNRTDDRMGRLVTAFAHHADGSGVFESGSNPTIVGQAAYNSAYGTDFVASGWCNAPTNPTARCDGFARINEQGGELFKFDTLNGAELAIPLEPKGIHDEMNSATFDPWGRMTANLGLEVVPATPANQNIVLYPYANPVTEILDASGMPSSLDVTPISSAADGTQIWKITHNGVDTHPIHWHLYDVQVLNRVAWDNNVQPPEPNELGWKDTVRINPLQDTYVAIRPIVPVLPFAVPDSVRPLNPVMPLGARGSRNGAAGTEAGFNNTDANGQPIAPIVNEMTDFNWEYVFHCHILSHEEMDMMRPVSVYVGRELPAAPLLSLAKGSVILTWTDGTPVDYADPLTWGDLANEIGYRIERATGSGPYAVIGTALANVTTFTDTTAVPNETYLYRVIAFNEAGSVASNIASTAPPASPTGLVATAVGLDTINLTWTDASTDETGFTVERCTGAGCTTFTVLASALAANTTTYADTGLPSGTSYSYRVFASNVFADSAPSNVATAVTNVPPPAGPTGLAATATGSSTIDLAWTDNASDETGYRVERCEGAGCTTFLQVGLDLAADATSFGDTGLTPNTSYSYRVVAYNTGGSSPYSDVATATTMDVVPADPTGLTATPITAIRIDLAWADNASNEAGYRVERCTGATCTNFAQVGADLAAGTTSMSDTGLAPATTYRYRVVAFNATGVSGYSNVATATTLDIPPAAPSNLVAVAGTTTRVDLTWTDNAANETGFTIQRATNVAFTNPSIITLNGADQLAFSNGGRTPGATYWYRIRAFNGVGFSAWSNVAVVTMTGAAPAAPSNLVAAPFSTTQIDLTWTDNATNETGFTVQRSLSSAFTNPSTTTLNTIDATTFSSTGRAPGTTYYYRVRAFNGFGVSAWSNTASATTVPVIGAVPTDVTVTTPAAPDGRTSLVVSWTYTSNGAAGPILFDVQRSSTGTGNWQTIANDTAALTVTSTGLPPNTTRYYRVRTVTPAGNSAYSTVVSGQTLP